MRSDAASGATDARVVTLPGTATRVDPGARSLASPVLLRQVELARGFADIAVPHGAHGPYGERAPYAELRLLVRLHRRPLGIVSIGVSGRDVVTASELAAAVVDELGDDIHAHLRDDALQRRQTNGSSSHAIPPTAGASCTHEVRLARAAKPYVSVVVTTCNDAAHLVPCVRSILASSYDMFEVVVVENRPRGSTVAHALRDAFAGDSRVRYAEEPIRGLSAARNRGADEARGDVVVFTDDDVIVDRHWLAHVVLAFVETSADCVTGLILPYELETSAQRWLEEFGGFAKGFRRVVYDARSGDGDPLYPYAAGRFGSGANTALLTSVAREIGPFDTSLGAGTASAGGEDLDLYIGLLRGGRRLTYEPAAIVWHRHHADVRLLARQLFHYGTGLSAALTKQLVAVPERRDVLRRVPRGLAYLARADSPKNRGKGGDYPTALTLLELAGLAAGPPAYLWARARRVLA